MQTNTEGPIKGEVLTYSPRQNENSFLPYTEKSIHTKHGKMYKVTTRRGFSITVTDDHSLATVGPESFFSPLPPAEAKGKFVPVVLHCSYDVDPDIERSAEDRIIENLSSGDPFHFTQDMLNVNLAFLAPLVVARVISKRSYTSSSEEELALAQVLLNRLGFPYEIRQGTLIFTEGMDNFIPEEGQLLPVHEVEKINPANNYLRLPYNWDEVISVEEVPREDTTYDFSVPEFPLFIGNNILVYDTMQLHVPATEGARTEALEKMLPSENLFSPRTGKPMMLPQQEHVFGLFKATEPLGSFPGNTKYKTVTDLAKLKEDIKFDKIKPSAPVSYRGHKTTAGAALINDLLPKKWQNYKKVWDKGYLTTVITDIGKTTPKDYPKVAEGLMDLGSLFSYKEAVSFAEKDFNMEKLKKKRDMYFNKIDKQLSAVDRGKGNKSEKYDKKVSLLRKAQAFSQKLTDDAKDNAFHQWAYTGSKGSNSQVMQIISSPTIVADPQNRVIPVLIHRSYNEGLSPSDYWISSYGTRKGTVGAKMSVAPAGALSKELVGNVLDVVVSEKDCRTTKGIERDLDDTPNVIDRYEAGTNKFIDNNYYELLKRRGVKKITVRSPMTCACKEGVCQMCYGYDDKRHLPEIGENVGVVSAHAVSEPLTQLGLSSKHTAGTAARNSVGFGTLKSFFNMSSKFSGSGVVTEVSGTITKILPAPTGGNNVYVDRKKYYIPPSRKIIVKIGDKVSAGDLLTDGVPNLGKIVPYKGIDAGRNIFMNTAASLYDKAGVGSLKKNFEVLARGIINYVEIQDPGDFDSYVTGDVVEYNALQAEIRRNPGKKPPTFVPVQKGTNRAATYKHDWLANFGFKYLKGELIENAANHATSKLHSYNPIPAYARGAHFGKGKNGKY